MRDNPGNAAVEAALDQIQAFLHDLFLRLGQPRFGEVNPDGDGGVQFTWRRGPLQFSVNLDADGALWTLFDPEASEMECFEAYSNSSMPPEAEALLARFLAGPPDHKEET